MKKQYFILLLFFPIILKAQINSNFELRKISEIELKDSYLSKPIVLSNGEYMMFVSSKKSEKGITESQIHLAHFDNNQWGIIPANIPLSEKYNNVPIGALKEKLGFYVFSIPKPSEKGESVINVLAFLNNEWVIERKIQIPEFFPEKKGFDLFMSSGENVILFSFYGENTYGSEDIYAMVKESDGSWSNLINLGMAINSKGSEISPFYDEKSNYLVYSSNINGNYEIFYSKRLDNSWVNWASPKKMIELQNKELEFHDFGFFYANNQGYFVRNSNNNDNMFYVLLGLEFLNEEKKIAKENSNIYNNKPLEECKNKQDLLESQLINLQNKNDSLLKSTVVKISTLDVYNSQKTVFKTISILFGFNSANLSPDGMKALDEVSHFLNSNNGYLLKICGYTDTKGSIKYNEQLSEKRANMVKKYLVKKGIQPSIINVKAMGKATINDKSHSSIDMEYFRRVDLILEVK